MKYEYWFARLKGISAREKCRIRSLVGSAKALYYIEEKELEKYDVSDKVRQIILRQDSMEKLQLDYEELVRKKVRFVTMTENTYPSRLKQIASPPYALYYKGKLPSERQKTVAIIGARECSEYGRTMTREYANELAKQGIQVISGMARGIDGVAQKSALEAGGESYAVLGCGVDICYPREHYTLYQDIEANGGILSEFPVGTEPLKQHFPARNRIISGLSDVILIMEAKEKSGSLITADMALEQGKDIYALPGLATSTLISPKDFLMELGICDNSRMKNLTENKIILESDENIVYSCLDFQPKNPGYISAVTKLPIQTIMDVLIRLQLKGLIREVSKNNYVTIRRK